MALSMTMQRRAVKGVGNIWLLLMLLWTAIPFYWMVATSLKHEREIYGFDATLIPQQPTLANYVTILYDTPYLLFLRNSIIVAVGSTILSMIIACLGSYAIARLNFPGRAFLARGLVFTYLVPTSLLFIPMFAMMSALRLTDSLHGLTIAYLGFDVPFCTWLLMGYFRSIPVELEEAGLVDGCNRIGVLLRIVLPLALPALVVVTFFSFTHAWNEFLYAHVFTSSDRVRTITTGLANFMTEDVFFLNK
jgi:multiple sugar transport system permease protein